LFSFISQQLNSSCLDAYWRTALGPSLAYHQLLPIVTESSDMAESTATSAQREAQPQGAQSQDTCPQESQ